jgi:hypothetical protein
LFFREAESWIRIDRLGAGFETGEETVFFPDDSDEPLRIVNEAVVRFSDALEAAQEFAVSAEMPKSIQWSEL